jgi:hypothetical protein
MDMDYKLRLYFIGDWSGLHYTHTQPREALCGHLH